MADQASQKGKDASSIVTILLPVVFAVILLILIVTTAFFLPCLIKSQSSRTKSDVQKRRMLNLERACQTQAFKAWCARHEEAHPEYKSEIMTCVICLETIEDKEKVRALDCNHVFHQQCLDDWYCRWNEFCPLCHRPILPHYVSAKKSPKSFISTSSVDAEHDSLAVMV